MAEAVKTGKWLKRTVWGTLGLVVLLVVAFIAAALYLRSDAGNKWFEGYLEELLSDPAADVVVDIEGLEGDPLDAFTVRRIRVVEQSIVLVDAEGVDIAWRPLSLVSMTARIDTMSIDRISLNDAPPAPEEVDEAGDLIPSIGVDLAVGDLQATALYFNNQEPAFGLAGKLNWRESGAIDIDLNLSSRETGGEKILLKVAYAPGAETLAVDGEVVTRAGGALGGFLLPGADDLVLSIKGDGALADWTGHVDGKLAGGRIADLELRYIGGKEGTLTVDGALTPGFLMSDRALASVLGELTLDIDMNFRRGLPQAYTASISAPAMALQLNGRLTTTDELLASRFVLGSRRTAALAPLLGDWTMTSFTATGQLPDPAAADVATDITFSVNGLTGPDVAPLDAEGRVAFRQLASVSEIGVSGSGTLTVPQFEKGRVAWSLSARLADDFSQVDLASLNLKGDGVTFSAAGRVGLEPLDLALSVTGEVQDVSRWPALADVLSSGAVDLSGDIAMRADDTLPEARVSVRGADIVFVDETLAALAGGSPVLELTTGTDGSDSKGTILIELTGLGAEFGVEGIIDPNFETVSAAYGLKVAGGEGTPAHDALGLTGPLTVEGDISGAFENPAMTARARAPDLTVEQLVISDIAIDVEPVQLLRPEKVSASISFALDGEPVTGRAGFALMDWDWREFDIELSGKPLSVSGRLRTAPVLAMDGKLTVKAPRNNLWGQAIGFPLTAAIDAQVVVESRDAQQGLTARITGSDVEMWLPGQGDVTAASVRATAALILGEATRIEEVELVATDVRSAEARLSDVSFTAVPQGEGLDLDLSAEGQFQGPLSFEARAQVERTTLDGPNTITLSSLSSTIAEQSFSLTSPATLERGADGGLSLTPLRLTYNDGSIEVAGSYGQAGTRLDVKAANLDVTPIALLAGEQNVFGTLDIALTADLTASSVANLSIELNDFLMGDELAQDPVDLSLGAALSEGQVDARLSIQTGQSLTLEATGRLPVEIVPDDMAVEVAIDRPVSLTVNGNTELEDVWPLTGEYEHVVGGNAAVDLVLGGTIDQPDLSGSLEITSLSYRHLVTGTRLAAPRVKFSVADEVLRLEPVTASDGNGGTLALSGWMRPFSPDGVLADLDAELDGVTVVRRRNTKAKASGNLNYASTEEGEKVTATVKIDEAEVSLVEEIPAEIVQLDVIEINRPLGLVALPQRPEQTADVTRLEATVEAANQFFVRGRGLESEWKGKLALKGDLAAPRISGKLQLIRGDFQFAGKRFELEEGTIDFTGGTDIDPVISARAVYDVQSITAQVNLSGPISNPKLSLSSRPELPDEEILSRIMFGTEKERLSAIQAAQLAAAAASMSGGGGGFDVVGKIRKVLTLERLEIGTREGEDGSTSALIRGGKYLTDNIYVEVGTARDEDDANSASIDIELTKHLTAGTEATTTGNRKLRIRWKWDY